MKRPIKWALWCLLVSLILFFAYTGHSIWKIVHIGTAYKAKILCSGVFVSKRDPQTLLSQDLSADDLSVLKYFRANIDYDKKTVTSNIMGLAERKAIFRPGLGCTLVIDLTEEEVKSQTIDPDNMYLRLPNHDQLWPLGGRVELDDIPSEINKKRLSEVINTAFSEPDTDRPQRTRAVVVVYDGRIIAERYAEGFSHNTPFLGWSMTKSVINALTGVLVFHEKLSVDDQSLLPEWHGKGDPRGDISLDHLLRMTSGLEFAEDYTNPLEDAMFMLLATGDMAGYAASKPLEFSPGSKWSYSSGTTNIISRIIRNIVGGTDTDYFEFAHRVLFDPIGMRSAIIEPDASGTFVGSSFMYATARDWARFGLLYLQDGIWEGNRIFPKDWVKYTTTPTDAMKEYGAHFWLKIPSYYRSETNTRPSLPADIFTASGVEGQFITIIPSRKLIVVRLGLSRLPGSWDHESFITHVLEAISLAS